MAGRAAFDVRCYAGSVGILVDRCLKQGQSLGTTWLADNNKAASCAHLVILYAELLPALKIYFPATRKEYGVVAASFHPQFKYQQISQMSRKALLEASSTVSLQENNLVVLSLSPSLPQMSNDFIANVNELLSCPPPSRDKGLSGNLAELDFPLVIQTITNARKHGTLEITNERNHTLAQIFLRDGRIVHSIFGDLLNERAIYQMTSQHLAGSFYFHAHKEPDWHPEQAIKHPADMLLIEAHRRLDEIPKYLLELGGEDTVYERTTDRLDLARLPAEVKEDAQNIWPLLDGRCPIGQLWRLAHLDDYTVFLILCELVKARQIRELQQQDPLNEYPMKPLEIASQLPLSPFDTVESLIVDEVTGLPHMQSGHLLGALRPSDPWHLIHDLDLPEISSGSPIFKDGKVIGVHCGRLPQDPGRGSAIRNLNQLIWVDALYQCLDLAADTQPVGEISQPRESVSTGGCTELARVDCPRCGSSSLASAKFCKSCGQRLLLDIKLSAGTKLKPLATLGAALAAVMVCVLLLYLNFGRTNKPTAPAKISPANKVEVTVDKADLEKAAWATMPKESIFHTGDIMRIRIKVLGDFFVYALHQGTTAQNVHLIYPDSPAQDKQYAWGSVLTIPRDTMTSPAKGKVALQGLTIYGNPGKEVVVLLASRAKSTLMTQPEQLSPVFLQATQILNSTPSETGLEVSPSVFGKSVFPDNINHQDKSVYLARFQIIHGE